jgi:DNA-binding NarL/FixJ family response regulator
MPQAHETRPELRKRLEAFFAGYYGRAREGRPLGLTSREVQVLRLLAAGYTNNEIAAQLVVSVHTIERHLQNAYRKIRVRNRADAAAYIVRQDGLIHASPGIPATAAAGEMTRQQRDPVLGDPCIVLAGPA